MTANRHSTPLAALAAVALLLALVLSAGPGGAEAGADDDDCRVAQMSFSYCTSYVAGTDDKVSPLCCRGLSDISDMAPGAAQRRKLCTCILSSMLAAGKVNPGRAAALPAACRVRIGFVPTSSNFDCSKIR